MIQIDAQAAGRAMFDETFNGTLFSTWEEQPQAFRDLMCTRASKIALAAVVELPDPSPEEAPGAAP